MSVLKSVKSWLFGGESRSVGSLGGLSSDNRFVLSDNLDLMYSDDAPNVSKVAGYPPVSQAIQMIAGDCAKIPARVYQRYQSEGGEDRYVRPNHYASTLIDLWGSPNDTDTTFDLLFDWFFDALLFGGGYLWIHRDGALPVSLHKLLPDRTRPLYYRGKRYFETFLGVNNGTAEVREFLPNDDVLFLPGINVGGLAPSNPIKLYADTFRQAINGAEFTAKHFKNGLHSGGILMAPPGAGETSINNVEQAIKNRTDKQNWFKTLVLKDGFRWQSVTSSIKDASMVELDESTARHVARIYNLPPSKLGLKDTVSYNSLDQDNKQYIDSCLSTWLIQARSQFHRKLVLPSEQSQFLVDYEIDYLNWADSVSRADVFGKLIELDVMTRDEVRRKYNLPPMKRTTEPKTLASASSRSPEPVALATGSPRN